MKVFLTALAAAALALPALADIRASASLTGLRYELVDLRPDDGIDPYVKFTGISQIEIGGYNGWCNHTSGSCIREFGDFTHPVTLNRGDPDLWGSLASAAGTALVVRDGMDTEGNGGGYRDVAWMRSGPGRPLFTLSAHTALRVVADYELDAWADPYRGDLGASLGYEETSARLFFQSAALEGGPIRRGVEVAGNQSSPVLHQRDSGQVSALFRNDLAHQATLWGRFGVVVDGDVPVIPEPSTWALMAAGLGLVGWTARRRRAG